MATRGQKNQEGKNGLGDHLAKKFQISKIMMTTMKMEMIRVTVLMTTMMMKMPMELLWKGTTLFIFDTQTNHSLHAKDCLRLFHDPCCI